MNDNFKSEDKITIIDPNIEYEALVAAARCDKGKIISISQSNQEFIDPFAIKADELIAPDPKGELMEEVRSFYGEHKPNIILLDLFKKTDFPRNNFYTLGTCGRGKAFHLWDDLKKCECGGSPWMEIEEDHNSKNYGLCKIRCLQCGSETPITSIGDAKLLWNKE